jgi:DNA-binding transcriptional ArsR family regulator
MATLPRNTQNNDLQSMRDHSQEASELLKSLANPNRLLILCSLINNELSVSQLNRIVDLSQSALSQHLAWLRERKLVSTRREAQTIYYKLSGDKASRIIAVLHDIYC